MCNLFSLLHILLILMSTTKAKKETFETNGVTIKVLEKIEHKNHMGIFCVLFPSQASSTKVYVTWYQSNKFSPEAPSHRFGPIECPTLPCIIPLREKFNKNTDDMTSVYCTASFDKNNKLKEDLISKIVRLRVKDGPFNEESVTTTITTSALKNVNPYNNMTIDILPRLKEINKTIVKYKNNSIEATKSFEGTYINLTCFAGNLPKNSSLMWIHYGSKNHLKQTFCHDMHLCKVEYEDIFHKEDNNTIAACVLQRPEMKQTIIKTLEYVLMIRTNEEKIIPKVFSNSKSSLLSDSKGPTNIHFDSTLPTIRHTTDMLAEKFARTEPITSVASRINLTPFIAASILIIILPVIAFLVYYFKFQRNCNTTEDQGPIYAVPEVHYAQLILPKSKNPFSVEMVKYSEVVGVLKPK